MESIQIIQINQTIKIFLASSEELSNDRNTFGNLIRRLNKTYEKRGIHLDLFEWEDHDAAYNDCRKQDEYNDQIRNSDMFLALFRTKAGKFTIEEFDVAIEEFRRTGKTPKNYVYIRDLYEGETETDELTVFKHRLSNEMGYFWIRYNNNDSLQLHFVMQLQLVESSRIDELKIENGVVKYANVTVANMDNLRFVTCNVDYQRMSRRLNELPDEIDDTRRLIVDHPEVERYKDKLQSLLNERNKLKEEFGQQQQFLLDTAMRITRLQGERITDRMRRAIEIFEEGKVHEANIILDEAEHDADQNLTDYRQSKELTEQIRQNVINSIEELLLKTSILMADASIPIDKRIKQTKSLYAKADQLASEVVYDKEKYSHLLFDYAGFLEKYGLYHDAETIYLRQIEFTEALHGKEHEYIASSYNNIGLVYHKQGDFSKALEYYQKALALDEKVFGIDHPEAAIDYNNIGLVYWKQDKIDKALEYYHKALTIRIANLGADHPSTATSYNNIGLVYKEQGKYRDALEYYLLALAIMEKTLGTQHPSTATTYNNIGGVYYAQGNYGKALEYYEKALAIDEKVLGTDHPETATDYNNFGWIYRKQKEYIISLEFYTKAYQIRKNKLGEDHPDTQSVLKSINIVKQALQSPPSTPPSAP